MSRKPDTLESIAIVIDAAEAYLAHLESVEDDSPDREAGLQTLRDAIEMTDSIWRIVILKTIEKNMNESAQVIRRSPGMVN